jgi:replication initiation protein RepC
MTLAMLATQIHARETTSQKVIDKWKLFRSLYEARGRLDISDRALVVLNALLSFYPKNELCEENGTIVFPSNAQLSIRTHGMAGTTLRRHIAALVDAGIISRKDSPNGKRYARKGGSGDFREAFGFNLSPLLARAGEIERLAADVRAEYQHLKQLKERLSICRRDIAKLIDLALEEKLPGDWDAIQSQLRTLSLSLPRTPQASDVASVLQTFEHHRDEIINSRKTLIKEEKKTATDIQNGGHIQNSDKNSNYESEANAECELTEPATTSTPDHTPSLATVLRACPEITPYGPSGFVSNWRDLFSAASVVRNMLAVSQTAYEKAYRVMGPQNTAIVIACILQRAEHINSPGGYLRDLTQKAERSQFSPKPMLMALLRSKEHTEISFGPVVPKSTDHLPSKEQRLTMYERGDVPSMRRNIVVNAAALS